MIKYKVANIVDEIKTNAYDAVIHGCNCQNTMGSGIALALRNLEPSVYDADLKTQRGDFNKLGNFTFAYYNDTRIYNIYQQFRYGKDGKRYVIYPALELGLMKVAFELAPGSKIISGKIGCSLAGGDWNIVSDIIDRTLCKQGHEVTICELK
jgi:hypothetical protein